MEGFARTCEAVAQTPRKLEKIALVAAYLRALDDADLEPATRFFTGEPLPRRGGRALAAGGSTLVAAAQDAWHFDDAALRDAYRAHGDLGTALGALFAPPLDLGLFRAELTPRRLAALLEEIASTSGRSSNKRRRVLCERILTSCASALEAKYAVKILTGDLRIGLRAGLVVDAIARAFERDPAEVRRAAASAGDLGAVARAARADRLSSLAIGYGAPIAFMLATPIPYGDYRELAGRPWLVEDKLAGIRVQAHAAADVRLFSRTLKDGAAAFPEIAAALAALPGPLILDGEIVAERDGRILPFRYLQTRLQRKDVSEELRAEVPVAYVVFDVLACGDELLVDMPLARRRALLGRARARERRPRLQLLDAAYVSGRRGKWWLKLKRELATLDVVVVVAVEWGHGKRARVLSDYTFAVRGAGGALLTIGKAYSGLTDVEIAEMTAWFLAHRLDDAGGHGFAVEPAVVIEVAFDVIQKSDLHASGYALRFPRIVRLRPDKPASEIDTLEAVDSLYGLMLAREGVAR